MKRRMRKFSEGGASALDDLAEGREKGSFDQDVYARARRFLESQKEAPKPTATARKTLPRSATSAAPAPAPAPAPSPAPSRAEIPTSGAPAGPASTGAGTSGPSDLDRVLMGVPVAGAGIAGAAKLKRMYDAKRAADAAEKAAEITRAATTKFSQSQTPRVAESGRRFTDKQELQAAESAARGAASRRQLREAKAARTAEAKQPRIMQDKPAKPARKTDYREDESGVEFSKGGSVRGGGCEQRGKTKGKFR